MQFVRKIWLISFFLNLFLLYVVFDILFKSPVVSVDSVFHPPPNGSRYKRLVFIVADGLRADLFFDHPEITPYFRELMENGDSVVWGISDAKVPTESRPGHVALFAGFYEDPSAIFTGWQQNLVPFDTVFDEAEFSVLLGSPDVVNMFGLGKQNKRIIESYPSDWQDFLAQNSSVLDEWVLDRFQLHVKNQRIPLHNKVIVFLHLLGIDNTGHATKPRSTEYMDNIALVDKIVASVHKQSLEYFQDDDTLFVFTSDHGMTDQGSHGGGSPAETETPFVIWGPGLRKQSRLRLSQVDFAAFTAGALNIAFPTNSMGLFPASIWSDQKFTFEALKVNFYQIQQLMLTKKAIVEQRVIPLVRFDNELDIQIGFNKSVQFGLESNFDAAVELLTQHIQLTQEGSKYYERYDQTLLKSLTVVTCIMWFAILTLSCPMVYKQQSTPLLHKKYFMFMCLLSVCFVKGVYGWSIWRALYAVVPLYLLRILQYMWQPKHDLKVIAGLTCCYALAIEILVFSFHQRGVLSGGLVLSVLWCMLYNKKRQLEINNDGLALFCACCLAAFPFLPIASTNNEFFMTIGPGISAIGAIAVLWKKPMEKKDSILFTAQVMILFLVAVLIHFPESTLTRFLAWTSLLLTPAPTFLTTRNLFFKLLSIFLAIQTPFAFLSLTYESLFLPCLFVVLVYLLQLELTDANETWVDFCNLKFAGLKETDQCSKELNVSKTFRTAWLHLFFTFLSFFGIGNIVSLSSFNPSAVRCFVSVFNPFLMMALLLVKIVGPFLLVASVFRVFTWSTKQVETNFLVVLLLSQGMALHMFLMVQNEGSWLEIGTSIAQFVIVQVSTLFLLLLHYLSNILVSTTFDSSLVAFKND